MRLKEILVYTVAGCLVLPAQQIPGVAKALVDQNAGTLKINVLEGEGAKNSVRSRTAAPPVVEPK